MVIPLQDFGLGHLNFPLQGPRLYDLQILPGGTRSCLYLLGGREVRQFCRHNAVQLCIPGESVHKGQDNAAIEQQPLPFAGMRNIRDPQLGVKISSINFSDKAVEDFNFLLPVAVLVFGSRMNDNFVNQGIQ